MAYQVSNSSRELSRYMEGVFANRFLNFAANSLNNPFALPFYDEVKKRFDGQAIKLAVLGSGNGRDALYFALKGAEVITFELSQRARDMTKNWFSANGIEDKLAQFIDFRQVDCIQPKSLEGAYAVCSLCYMNPEDMIEIVHS